ncbi:MAG: nucleotide exchange factor GrpE [Nanoarchaeota archaeon]|nr:nucleotide exchange factor GrpE [Nanoarchaeota archaeon]MBU1854175.1 nucleotide exchange factor GrpE [Nanoarchaeota archaeon]
MAKTKKTTQDKNEAKELKESLQRLQAEFENYKKRIEKEAAEFKNYAETDIIKSLLPTLDNFELALKNNTNAKGFAKGIELIYAQLYQMLEDKGLKIIQCEGCKFDPYKHEALLTEESDKEENIVLEELQKGYMYNDKVIRHTKVKVSKKKTNGGK